MNKQGFNMLNPYKRYITIFNYETVTCSISFGIVSS